MFILVCLFYICLFALFMWVVFVFLCVYLCACVCVCLSLLFLIRSQQSVARWELYLSFAYWSLSPPHVKHRTLLLSAFPNNPCCPPSQDALGYDHDFPPSLHSSLLEKPHVPILGHPDKKTILGIPPHSFQKTNIQLQRRTNMNLHWIALHLYQSKPYLSFRLHVNLL